MLSFFINFTKLIKLFKKKRIKLTWTYRYVPEGQLEPDQNNRWLMVGYMMVDTRKILTHLKFSKEAGVPVAYIFQKGCKNGSVPSVSHKFACCFPSMDDTGYENFYYFGNTVEEVKQQVEEEINKTYNIFKHSI